MMPPAEIRHQELAELLLDDAVKREVARTIGVMMASDHSLPFLEGVAHLAIWTAMDYAGLNPPFDPHKDFLS